MMSAPNEPEQTKPLWRKHLPLEHETALFILVSFLDLIMTATLMFRSDDIIESNPVAVFFLNRWGLRGLVYFKFGVVLFVCVLTQIIAARDLRKGRFVLMCGTLVVSFVVIYSLSLYVRHHYLSSIPF